MRLDRTMPHIHLPHMNRRQVERAAVGVASLVAAALIAFGITWLFKGQPLPADAVPAFTLVF
jgi:hypothetical protein